MNGKLNQFDIVLNRARLLMVEIPNSTFELEYVYEKRVHNRIPYTYKKDYVRFNGVIENTGLSLILGSGENDTIVKAWECIVDRKEDGGKVDYFNYHDGNVGIWCGINTTNATHNYLLSRSVSSLRWLLKKTIADYHKGAVDTKYIFILTEVFPEALDFNPHFKGIEVTKRV